MFLYGRSTCRQQRVYLIASLCSRQGVFTVLFIITVYVLRKRARESANKGLSRVMMGTAVAMYVLATMVTSSFNHIEPFILIAFLSQHQHVGVNFSRIIKAFIIYSDEPGGPGAYFNQLSNFTNIFGSAIYMAQTILGDGFVVSCVTHLLSVCLVLSAVSSCIAA